MPRGNISHYPTVYTATLALCLAVLLCWGTEFTTGARTRPAKGSKEPKTKAGSTTAKKVTSVAVMIEPDESLIGSKLAKPPVNKLYFSVPNAFRHWPRMLPLLKGSNKAVVLQTLAAHEVPLPSDALTQMAIKSASSTSFHVLKRVGTPGNMFGQPLRRVAVFKPTKVLGFLKFGLDFNNSYPSQETHTESTHTPPPAQPGSKAKVTQATILFRPTGFLTARDKNGEVTILEKRGTSGGMGVLRVYNSLYFAMPGVSGGKTVEYRLAWTTVAGRYAICVKAKGSYHEVPLTSELKRRMPRPDRTDSPWIERVGFSSMLLIGHEKNIFAKTAEEMRYTVLVTRRDPKLEMPGH